MTTQRAQTQAQPHLSHSQVQEFTQCPRRYHLHRRLALPPEHIPSGLIFGSALHEALALHSQHRLEGNLTTLQELCHVFDQCWNGEHLAVQYGKGESEESLRELARKMLAHFLTHHEPAGKVLAVEEPFMLHLSASVPPVHGRIDLAEVTPDGRLVVTDFKSAKQRKEPRPEQLVLYREAVGAFSGDQDVSVTGRSVVLLKTKEPGLVTYEPEIVPGDLQALTTRYEEVWKAIEWGCSFAIRNWMCGGCQWASYCSEM